MKATLSVRSEGRGKGASFTLELPAAPEGSLASNAYRAAVQ